MHSGGTRLKKKEREALLKRLDEVVAQLGRKEVLDHLAGKRGRPKGSGIDDSLALEMMAVLLNFKLVANPTEAARIARKLTKQGRGETVERRLRDKLRRTSVQSLLSLSLGRRLGEKMIGKFEEVRDTPGANIQREIQRFQKQIFTAQYTAEIFSEMVAEAIGIMEENSAIKSPEKK